MKHSQTNRRHFLKAGAAALGLSAGASVATAESSRVEGYQYALPKFKKKSRLVFIGDSITDMKRGRNESDRNHYLGHSYVYLIASRLGVEMPEAELDFYNRGISGNKVSDLRKRWQKDAVEMKPDVLSILVGVNDRHQSVFTQWELDYRYLLEASVKANPDLKIVLLDPFVLASGKLADPEVYKQRRQRIDEQIRIVGKLAHEFNTVRIRTQEIFDEAAALVSPEHWLWDGVHPLPAGHELIARNWIFGAG